jgi:serine protease Do
LAYLARANQTLNLAFLRGGKKINTRLVPESLPGQPTQGSESRLGITAADISSSMAYRLGTNDAKGVVVAGVEKGSVADEVGLEVGDIIRQINDQRIRNVEEYEKLINKIKSKDRLILLIERDGALYFVSLEP